MFKTLTAFAVTAYSAYAGAEDALNEASSTLDLAQCNSVLVDGIYFDISKLNKADGQYSKSVGGKTLEFNYCETF